MCVFRGDGTKVERPSFRCLPGGVGLHRRRSLVYLLAPVTNLTSPPASRPLHRGDFYSVHYLLASICWQ